MAVKSLTPMEIEKLVREKPKNHSFLDLEGRVFGRLTVGRYLGRKAASVKSFHHFWECACQCGTVKRVAGAMLTRGSTVSCGCYRIERSRRPRKHGCGGAGHKRTPEYTVWSSMKSRCLNPNDDWYYRYGGRGITIHPAWVESFAAFLSDVGTRPSAGMTIERKNNDGNYEPGNVVWATRKAQARNRRTSKWLTINGETKTLAEWVELSGTGYGAIQKRLRGGWEPHAAVFTKTKTCSRSNTGFRGVSRTKHGRYAATLYVNGKNKHLGKFDTPELAYAAYQAALAEKRDALQSTAG